MSSTRSNLHKNPSFSYKKDSSVSSVLQNLRAYNAATGTPYTPTRKPLTDDADDKSNTLIHQRKKRKQQVEEQQSTEETETSFTHRGYIEKISAGHLNIHIGANTSHQRFYSYKLKRLVKCCKTTCNVTEIKDLLVCHYCLSKAFDKFYDMYTSSWKVAGLKIISGSVCCEDHFTRHRVNCCSADVEGSARIMSQRTQRDGSCQISDFIF